MSKPIKIPKLTKNKFLIGLYDNILTTPLNYILSTSKFIAKVKSEESFYLGKNTVSDNLCVLSEKSEIFNKEEYNPEQIEISIYVVNKTVFEYILTYYDCGQTISAKNFSELTITNTCLGPVPIIKYVNSFYIKNI